MAYTLHLLQHGTPMREANYAGYEPVALAKKPRSGKVVIFPQSTGWRPNTISAAALYHKDTLVHIMQFGAVRVDKFIQPRLKWETRHGL